MFFWSYKNIIRMIQIKYKKNDITSGAESAWND